ncbi:MAG: phosphodiesterase [Candidatus Binatia bacterium]|nr:MAG: phosphodiesterase [Candidatus Binatia bacterium]
MLFVLGLDGGTLRLLEPWVEEGRLPNFGRLLRVSAWGELRSVLPPATMPNWTTLMTGVNPGRHGIFDFTARTPEYGIRFVNGSYRRCPTIWSMLSLAGRRVAVLGMPGTYPPEPVNGRMISGFDSPVTTRAGRSFVYPPEWADDVLASGGFPYADFQEFHVGRGWYERALARLLGGIETKTRLAERLLREESWDCFVLVLGESDTVAHHFWQFFDPDSPRYRPGTPEHLGTAIERVYQAVDRALGTLLEVAAPRAVLVASDHGFGGSGTRGIYLNRWLARRGWLAFTGKSFADVFGRARSLAARVVPAGWQAHLVRLGGGRLAGELEARARFAGIDWTRTRAFSEELNYFPSIWLNVRGRDASGRVDPAEYEKVRDELIEDLHDWSDPATGRPVIRRAWRREELYAGPAVERAPDIVLELEEPAGYSYLCLRSAGRPGECLRELAPPELEGGKALGLGGSHRPDGVFALAAPGLAPGRRSGVSILDVAPTILSLCGLRPPEWMEGTSLVEGEAAVSVSVPDSGGVEAPYSSEEEREIESRLRALGYFG